jgi:DNA-binding transcriptional LysR family regulator
VGGRRAHVPGAQRPDSPNASRATLTDDCLNWHATADTPPYRWEFTDNGHDFSVAVRARVLSTDAGLNRRLVIAGLGITLAYEEHVRGALARGQLVSVLEEFCVPFPGYYL